MKISPEGLLNPEQVASNPLRNRRYGLGAQNGTRIGHEHINLGSTRAILEPAHSREADSIQLASGYRHASQALAAIVSGNLQSIHAALDKMDTGPSSLSREKFLTLLSRKAKLLQNPVCLQETHQGTITEILDNEVEVTYELPEGPLKQIYRRDQFLDGKVPSEGDKIEAEIIVSLIRPPKRKAEAGSALPEFNERAESGTIRL